MGYSFIDFLPCIYIDFSKNPILLNKYTIFADNPIHNFMYAVNIKHNYVCAIDEDGDVVYYCAKDFNSFICATTVLVEDEANLCLNNSELDLNQRNIRANLCANLAGGEKYKQFYEFLYCVDINE
jgi:hypothetical protein